MAKPNDDLTAEQVRALLSYAPETGELVRLVHRGNQRAGDIAGGLNERGYWVIKLGAHEYRAHRLAWLIQTGEWPPFDVDHINQIKSDNRFCNLRLATRQQNLANKGPNRNCLSGARSVCWNRRARKWRVQLTVGGKRKSFGYYKTIGEAERASRLARASEHGEFLPQQDAIALFTAPQSE